MTEMLPEPNDTILVSAPHTPYLGNLFEKSLVFPFRQWKSEIGKTRSTEEAKIIQNLASLV